MAYNPFDFFRKNQKIMFAGLTVMIMFMFVLSFGRGDFFDWFPKWLGGKKSRGEVLAVIDGDKFQESEASRIRSRRGNADKFMMAAAERAKAKLMAYAKDNANKVSAENRSAVQGVLDNHEQATMMMRLPSEMQQMYLQQVPTLYMSLIKYQSSLSQVLALFKNPNAKADDLDVANVLRKYIFLTDLTSLQTKQYFYNQPNKNAKDAIEYTLWLKKADQLKIHFRTEDIDSLIDQEFLQLKSDDREKILQEMVASEGRQTGLTKDGILDAIGDEFRVRLAQIAVLGLPDVSLSANLASGHAPFDFYEYYRTETSAVDYAVIGVPVENYMSKVEGQPTETELREIFNKAKNTEPDPGEPKIGIKKGRELKLGWLEITGKEPFYETASADALVKAEVAAKMSGLFAVPFGPGAIGNALSASMLKVEDPALQGAYDFYRRVHGANLAQRWFSDAPSFRKPPPVLDTSYANPQVVAATVGLAASPLGTAANRFTVSNATIANADIAERRQRLYAGLAMIPAPTLGGLAVLTQHTGNLATTDSGLPKALPLAAVKGKLVVDSRESLRFGLAQSDIQKLEDELAKIRKDFEKDDDREKANRECAAYIAKFANPASNWIDRDGKAQLGRGLKLGGSTNFYDVHTIGDDPGLIPLKDRLKQPHGGQTPPFGKHFFVEQDFSTGQQRMATSLFVPTPYPEVGMQQRQAALPNENESQYLVWRAAEMPAEAAKDFDKARPKCVEIWKRQKAREIARKAAEELSAQAGTFGKDKNVLILKHRELVVQYRSQFPIFSTEYDRVKTFEILNVARTVVTERQDRTGLVLMGTPYSIDNLRSSSDIPYPTQKMVDDLVANRTKDLSTSFVMVDKPETNFYVTVLIDRVVSDKDSFLRRIYSPESDSMRTNHAAAQISRQFNAEAHKQALEEAVELLKAEFKYEKETENKEKLSGTSD